jgi:hypothetical protein
MAKKKTGKISGAEVHEAWKKVLASQPKGNTFNASALIEALKK